MKCQFGAQGATYSLLPLETVTRSTFWIPAVDDMLQKLPPWTSGSPCWALGLDTKPGSFQKVASLSVQEPFWSKVDYWQKIKLIPRGIENSFIGINTIIWTLTIKIQSQTQGMIGENSIFKKKLSEYVIIVWLFAQNSGFRFRYRTMARKLELARAAQSDTNRKWRHLLVKS